jgi:hypothetical protein
MAKHTLKDLQNIIDKHNETNTYIELYPKEQIYTGNRGVLNFRCIRKHEFKGSIDKFINNKSTCIECKKIEKGNEYRIKLKTVGLMLISEYTKPKDKHSLQCLSCEYEWKASISSKLSEYNKSGTNGCPMCASVKTNRAIPVSKISIDLILKSIIERNKTNSYIELSPPNQEYKNQNGLLMVRCEYGHIWKMSGSNIMHTSNGCPDCQIKKNKRHSDEYVLNNINERNIKYPIINLSLIEQIYTGKNNPMEFTCDNGHRFESTFQRIMNNTTGCDMCEPSIYDIIKCDLKIRNLDKAPIYLDSCNNGIVNKNDKIKFICSSGHRFMGSYDSNIRNGSGCVECSRDRIKNKYFSDFERIGLTIISEYTAPKNKHSLSCNTCNYEWEATLISKIQNNIKNKKNGCPKCRDIELYTKRYEKILDDIRHIKASGYIVIDESEINGNSINISVRRISCNHIFKSKICNIAEGQSNCPECNDNVKKERLKHHNDLRHSEFMETADEWGIYKSLVYSKTSKVYNNNVEYINPNNLKRVLAGEYGYQLDHIMSIRWCFDNGIPVEACSDKSNLRMITWEENIKKGKKVDLDCIPESIKPYIEK